MPYARLPYVLALVPVLVTCSDDGASPSDRSASMAGRVAIAGQSSVVAGASIAVDQIRVDDGSGAVREHIGDTTSDAEGRFQLDGFGERNGLFLVTSSGGSFRDLVSGQTVELDPSDQIRTLITLDLFEERTDALVSGVGHLTEALARQRLAAGLHPDLYEAREFAATRIDAHFGGVTWQRIDPARLDTAATSATDPVRAALVAEAWAILSNDIATAAGASPQEVNVYSLMEAWAIDLASPPFDGQDNNNNAQGSGVQLGECPAVPSDCVPAPPAPACSLGSCRTECDLYSGTPRAALSGALLKLVRSEYNQTGLVDTAILPLARSMAENTDDILFSGCVDNLDRTAPSIFFESPSPLDGAFVRGTISVRVRAIDDIDTDPDLLLLNGIVDADGDDSNAVATAEVSSTADGPLTVDAKATDAAGNSSMTSRTFNFDNTDPQITLAPTNFYVQGADWWTGNATPVIGGTIIEANLDAVNVYAGASLTGVAIVTGGTWSFTLPAGAVPGLAGVDVRIEARDLAGGTASVTQRIRYDATPPVITIPDSTVRDESGDSITFDETNTDPIFGAPILNPTHNHNGPIVTLGPATACDLASARKVTKYAYLLDEQPPYATETNGAGPGGRNPLRWAMSITDDGVGVDYATVAFRVRDVAAASFPLDWTPLAGTGSYTVNLFRTAITGPSIPVLGTKEGLFEIQFRGRDRLGRDVAMGMVTRCWNHDLLAAPLYFGFPTLTGPGGASAPTNGPAGSGKYGLTAANFSLADTTSPLDPVSMLMNAPSPGVPSGVGLMQFPVYNPTNETVYLSIDLEKPTSGVAGKRYYQNRWTFTESTVSVTCGTDPGGGPDQTTPGCEPVSNPGAGNTGIVPSAGLESTPIPPSNYSVRVWEEPIGGGAYVELTQCAACSTTATEAARTRVTVMIPPRGPPVATPTPRKFWIVPVLVGPIGLQPGAPGPYSEFSAGGVSMSGAVDETRVGCWEYTQVPPYRCIRRRTYRNFRATWHAEVTGIPNVNAYVRTSWTTSGDEIPKSVAPSSGLRTANVVSWSSDEPTQPN